MARKKPNEPQGSAALDKPFSWNEKTLLALSLIFEGRLTREQIAEKCTIAPRTLYTWLEHPEFAARLQEMRDNALDELLRLGVPYVSKEARIIALAQLAESARSEYEAHTILIEQRPTRNGPATTETFNRDAFECFRGALDDIAKELGHRTQKQEVSGPNGGPIEIIANASATFDSRIAAFLAAADTRSIPSEPNA